MAFLRDDEFLILMDTPLKSGRMLTVDELKQLRDAGIRTAYWAGPLWDDFSSRDHSYRWEYFDDYLERMRQADLKCLIPLWHKQSTRYPAEYYIKRSRGYIFGTFSPWNPRAQETSNRMLEMVRDRITSSTCQVISGQNHGGERVLLNEPAYYDDYALADWQRQHDGKPDHRTAEGALWLRDAYTRLLLEQQRILVNTTHHEIWYMLSRYKPLNKNISCHGCEHIDHYLSTWEELSPTSINHVSFNYFPYGEKFYPVIQQEQKQWQVNEFVGAEYCEGLRQGNGKLAVEHGLRGMIIGPTHPFTNHLGIMPWMIDAIRETHELFMQRHQARLKKAKARGRRKVSDRGAHSGRGLPHEKNSQCEESR